jgi:hypothetical protein
MSTTRERVMSESAPDRHVEHDLRYALVAPLIRTAALWVDLGSGAGVPATTALAGALPERTLLVDIAVDALEEAGRELRGAQTLVADLATTEGADAVREAIGSAAGERVVTCFETLSHLGTFVPLVELLLEFGDAGFTVVLSVPNEAFWSIENPFHPTMWGEGSFEELRRLAPDAHVVLEQVPLVGSAIAPPGAASLPLADATLEERRVPSHFLLAFGPQAGALAPRAAARVTDAEESRRWERERSSELAFLAARVAELEGTG